VSTTQSAGTRASFRGDEVYPLVIGGREVATAESFASIDPSTGQAWTRVGEATPADVEAAVAAARSAFRGWRETSPATRQATLERLADAIEGDADWPSLLATENGRPIREARIADVPTAADVLRYFAGLARGLEGATVPTGSRDSLVWTTREPLGVIGALIPWNSPLISTALKVAPALAAGNTIVLKPSELASPSVVEFARRVGHLVPDGVINVVTGYGPAAGAALVASPGVAKVSFTGGIPTARRILASIAENITPALLELGGKSAFVICEDADLDAAVADATMGIAFQNGEVCFAASRLYLHESVHAEFLERFAAALARLRIGDALDETTHVGPLVSQAHRERVRGFVEGARVAGARVIGGAQLTREGALAGGFYLEPAIIDDPSGQTTAAREEIFGPVVTVQTWRDEEDVIERANGLEYGLAAGVWTSDLGRAHRIAQQLDAGTVWINTWFDVVAGQPLGGVKASGYGREMCAETMLEYTSAKAVSMRISSARPDLWS
jgi:aldehyde dehydrogenase